MKEVIWYHRLKAPRQNLKEDLEFRFQENEVPIFAMRISSESIS